jgi:hypothetical protein
MKNFKELFESKKPTVGSVKKVIKNAGLGILYPEAFDVEKKTTDIGLGGYYYIQIAAWGLRPKDKKDVDKVIKALNANFKDVEIHKNDGNVFIASIRQ